MEEIMDNAKNIFILTSSGKPVYASHGNEEDLVNTFGLIQAMISIVQQSQDTLRCITMEDRTIVFLLRNTLYFVVVASTGEPENVLLRQLDFMYQHILLILTSKVQNVLENNPSTDIRQLLGSDSDQILGSSCQGALAPACVAFHSIATAYCDKPLRDDIAAHLKICVEHSGAAMGLLMSEDLLFSAYKNPSLDLNLTTADVILLTHFVANSKSLRTNDQHWVPLCLPAFNPNGYLQMYISNVPVSGDEGQFILILIAVSSEGESFSNLLKGKRYFEKAICLPELVPRIIPSIPSFRSKADTFRDDFECLHFLYKFALLLPKGDTQTALSQCVQSTMKFPLLVPAVQQQTYIEYQRLALRLRKGSCELDCTMTSADDLQVVPGAVSSKTWGIIRRDKPTEVQSPGKEGPASQEAAVFDGNLQILSSLPHVDHSLAYTVCTTGLVLVGFASYDSELFVSFPSSVSTLEACTRAEAFSRTLKACIPLFSSQII